MQLWVQEVGPLQRMPYNQQIVVFMDNCSGHAADRNLQMLLWKINTCVRLFLLNTTDLLQSATSFIMQNIKILRTERW